MRTLLPLIAISVSLSGAVTAEPVLKTYYVEESYAIVVGRLTEVIITGTDSDHRGTGVVDVQNVIVGPVKRFARLPFAWTHNPKTAAMCPPSLDHRFASNRLGVWFVERGEDGSVRVWGEFWNLEDPVSIQFHIDYLVALEASSLRSQAVLKVLEAHLMRFQTGDAGDP